MFFFTFFLFWELQKTANSKLVGYDFHALRIWYSKAKEQDPGLYLCLEKSYSPPKSEQKPKKVNERFNISLT